MAGNEWRIINQEFNGFGDIFCFAYAFQKCLVNDALAVNFIKLRVVFRPLRASTKPASAFSAFI